MNTRIEEIEATLKIAMKTEEQIREELAALKDRLEADEDSGDTPDWIDTSNRITALEWVLGEGDEEKL